MPRLILAVVLVLAWTLPAAAEYPERPLTIVAAYPAGGMVDIVARPMAESMKKKFPKGVTVLNRPGGGGSVGLAEVVQAKPDGYTVILAPVSTLVIHPQLNPLPYKTPDDYEPIMNTIAFSSMLVVQHDSPWKTAAEFVNAAKAAPGKLRVASPGEGTSSHLNLEQLMVHAKVKVTHVPFSGWGETSPAILGGHVDAVVAQPGEIKPLVDAKKLRPLLAFQDKRQRLYPDTPTAKEAGWPTALGTWFVLTAPKGTPPAVLKYLHDAAKAAIEEPSFVTLMNNRGVDIEYKTAEKCRADLWTEYRLHTDILKRLGMIKN
ncbi:MAG TPA: tripartite tricarboxylate transporter substrate binding protein [Methylomirabilota bacterium]|jgi:tripartite-type tricarboxylate transporter receptor subunit TctC|nr:tripartite tricarboxylate transporter substrate binding protein [Methylomirabilota bacterium]